jgi:26S proteasome regulatory subunit T5
LWQSQENGFTGAASLTDWHCAINFCCPTDDIFGAVDEELQQMEQQISSLDAEQLKTRTRMLDNNIRVMKSEATRLQHEQKAVAERIKENNEKIKMNKQLPYLVSNVIEILDLPPEIEDEGAAVDEMAQRHEKCVVIKTSTRQTVFLPVVGLVDPVTLKPGDLVGVNKDSYLILDTLPTEYDSRVKAMEVDEKPTEDYSDVGGLDKQIQELVEAVVRPITHAELFKAIGIKPPKGCLMYGPPGV